MASSSLHVYEKQRDEMYNLLTEAAHSNDHWNHWKHIHGVDVYWQDCPHTGLKRCKAIGIARATIEEVGS
jgi:hypothetical protein